MINVRVRWPRIHLTEAGPRRRLVVNVMEHSPIKLKTIQLVESSSLAAAVMGQRRAAMASLKRGLTGHINGKRRRKFSLLRLPNGRIGELLGSLRGQVFFRWLDHTQVDPIQIGTAPETEVTYYPLPAAQALARLRRGIKERPSAKKAAASRRNGARPARPGSRPRGRPPAPIKVVTSLPPD